MTTAAARETGTKSPTGIAGFDAMTGGGVPRGRTTLVIGGPGSGKTIFGLQFLAEGVKKGEPGIFVAFEEATDRIVANAEGFGLDLEQIGPNEVFFLDAQPSPDLVQLGDFDLGGMLSSGETPAGSEARAVDGGDDALPQLASRPVRPAVSTPARRIG